MPTVWVRRESSRVSRMELPSKIRPSGSPLIRIPAVPVLRPLARMALFFERVWGGGAADSVGAVADDLVAPKNIVRVLVADRDSKLAVLFQSVVLEYTVTNPPAEEESVGPVAPGDAVPDDRPL